MIARCPTSRIGSEFPGQRTARFRRTLAGLGALLALGATASAASAQSGFYASPVFYDEPEMLLPPRAVVSRLQGRGFTEIARPRFDGTAYIIDATSPSGSRTRLFVDARDGAMLGRQRLDTPYFPSARPSRPAPGYGWTEQDVRPGRSARLPDGLIPPANIPDVGPARPGAAEANPSGLNPEGKLRPAPAPRRTARLAPPQKPAAPNAAPAAPAPRLDAAQAPKPETAPAPETAKVEPPASEPAKAATTPAANQPQAVEKPVAEAPRQDKTWKDPPAEEAKRKVRVIDGATMVPGAGETAPSSTN